MSKLFSPFQLKNLTLKNRIVMPPMCMYSADHDGNPSDWHVTHYATRAIGGVGLILLEATGVESRGRISDRDLGLWKDEQIEATAFGQLDAAPRLAWSSLRADPQGTSGEPT